MRRAALLLAIFSLLTFASWARAQDTNIYFRGPSAFGSMQSNSCTRGADAASNNAQQEFCSVASAVTREWSVDWTYPYNVAFTAGSVVHKASFVAQASGDSVCSSVECGCAANGAPLIAVTYGAAVVVSTTDSDTAGDMTDVVFSGVDVAGAAAGAACRCVYGRAHGVGGCANTLAATVKYTRAVGYK